MMCQLKKQSGVALVTAILIVALASVLAASLLKRLNLDISRTQNIMQNEQAYLFALGAEIIASAMLIHDGDESKHDSLDELWAQQATPYPVENAMISGSLVDLQGKFNLNNLSKSINGNQAQDLKRFKRLLTHLKLNPDLANAIVDWLDEDMQSSIPDGAEDDYYIGLEQPYRAGNTLLSSPSELRLIKGFEEDKTYRALQDYICTLPIATAININTAREEVLKSLSEDVNDEHIGKLTERLSSNSEESSSEPFEDIADFETFMKQTTGKNDLKIENVVVSTEYFLLSSMAELGRGHVNLYSIIHRDTNNQISIVSRSQGAW